jgi:SpoIID/LytB domain protein
MQWQRYTSLFLTLTMLLIGVTGATAFADSGSDQDQIEAGWRAFQDEWGQSNASGNGVEVGNALVQEFTSAVNLLRVGLRYSYTPTGARSEFYSYNHPSVQLTGTLGQFFVVDQATGKLLATANAGDVYSVKHDGTNYVVTGPDGTQLAAVAGPVHFFGADPENTMKILSITRLNILTYASWVAPEYRGTIEISRGTATPAGTVNVVNIVELESYLRGNVVNESPASFHEEALKTQAVSARGYALANIGRFTKQGYPFDIDDSPGSQVYRGKTSEHPNGNLAVEGTRGIVASYNGKIINAFYSSSMAGFTENYEWSFSGTGSPAQAVPYLVGRYDGPAGTEPDLTTEAGRRAFWANDQPQVYDSKVSSGNGRNRWTFTLSRAQVEANLNARRSTALKPPWP